MSSRTEHLQHLADHQLMDLISQQKDILADCIECASMQRKNPESEGWNPDGLYFANQRYQEYIAELERRFENVKS